MTQRVIVVGAGIVGLSTAWFLQEHGAQVSVVDRIGPGGGASHGNAGWVVPGIAAPLTEPAALREGLGSVVGRSGALHLTSWRRPETWAFLARFARQCTPTRWRRASDQLDVLNRSAMEAFAQLRESGHLDPVVDAPVLAAYADGADAGHLAEAGGVDPIDPRRARRLVPQLADAAHTLLEIHGAAYLHPDRFVRSLADDVARRGGAIVIDEATAVPDGPVVVLTDGGRREADAVVIATGARLNALTRSAGVRAPVAAGRGYSFTVATHEPMHAPVYLPTQRLACTPVDGGMRIAGIMEIAAEGSQPRPQRFEEMARAAATMLDGVDWSSRREEWVGSRPLTSDGLPLIGATARPSVYLAGGHGMWGVTQGPVTGRLLAEYVTTGRQPEQLAPFAPLRSRASAAPPEGARHD